MIKSHLIFCDFALAGHFFSCRYLLSNRVVVMDEAYSLIVTFLRPVASPTSSEILKLGGRVSPTVPNPSRAPIFPDQLARFLHHSPPPPPPSHHPFLNLPAFPTSPGTPPPRLHHHHHLLQHGFSLPKNEATSAVISGGVQGNTDGDRRRGLFPSAPPPLPPHQQQQQSPPHQGSILTASKSVGSVASTGAGVY